MWEKDFRESKATIPQAIYDALGTEDAQVIGIQANPELTEKELKGSTIHIGPQGASIEGSEKELVLRRPLKPPRHFLALRPAGENGESCEVQTAGVLTIFELDRKRKTMTQAEERVKSTLQELETLIKAQDAHEAGARPELARKKWDVRKQLGLGSLAEPLAAVAWDVTSEMDSILQEDSWNGDGEAPKTKRKTGCFSHMGQKRQRKEDAEQLRHLHGSYAVKVAKPKEAESEALVASWIWSHTSDELLKEMSFRRMERGEKRDILVKLSGVLQGSGAEKLKLTGNQENDLDFRFFLGVLLPERQQMLVCRAKLFSISVYRPPPTEEKEGQTYIDQKRLATEGFGTDKRVRQNTLIRERIERNCEVADLEKVQSMVQEKVEEYKQEEVSAFAKDVEARKQILPPYFKDADSADQIYADGLEVIAKTEYIMREKRLLDERLLPLLDLKAPELERLAESKENDFEACGSYLALGVLRARGLQSAKTIADPTVFAKKIGVLKALLRILQDKRQSGEKQQDVSSLKDLARITRLHPGSPLAWQLWNYLYDEAKGQEENRILNRPRTICAALIWALNLVPYCWMDISNRAQTEFGKIQKDQMKELFRFAGCSVETKSNPDNPHDRTIRVALRVLPGNEEKALPANKEANEKSEDKKSDDTKDKKSKKSKKRKKSSSSHS